MSDSPIVLDTNAAVAIINNDRAAIDLLVQFDEWLLPVVVLAELRYGALKSSAVDKNLARLDDFRRSATIIDVTEAAARVQADLRYQASGLGRPIPDNDLWIAAMCVANNLPLATRDAHFDPFAQLTILRW